jgi:23S rRNA pseudouridine1911/1915/1917 synthase
MQPAMTRMTGRSMRFEVDQKGIRLDRFLAERVGELSRAHLQRLIHEGRATVDGVKAKPGQRLDPGQQVTLQLPPPAPSVLSGEDIAVPVIYEDDAIVVVDKPAGMVVHPGHGNSSGTLVNALLARYPVMRAFEESGRPGIVHRLDKGTSGVMVVAKTAIAQRHLQLQFAEHTVRKTYLVLVHGSLQPERGVIEAGVGRSRQHPTQMAISGRAERAAQTSFVVLERFPGYTLIEARPLTGRTHQIRLHFAALGHSLVGDATYGTGSMNLGLDRQFLHARSLRLVLPTTGEEREFQSELPADLQGVLTQLRQRTVH